MFIGRNSELQQLNTLYKQDKFQCVIIWGRRRVGKTTLINEFCKDKTAIYFTGIESTAKDNLENFSKSIAAINGSSDNAPVFKDFRSALININDLAQKQKIVLIIDEYPYLARSYKSISSVLQELIDNTLKANPNLFIILCGSSMSFMEKQVLGYQSPLYGRRTAQFHIKPFNFYEVASYYKNFSPEDIAAVYGITGGIPLYMSFINDKLSLKENIINNLDVAGLEKLWNATFTNKGEDFDTTLDYLFDGGIETEEGLINEMKNLLLNEINYRENERKKEQDEFMKSNYRENERKKEQDEFMKSLMSIEEQPLISQPKQEKRRKHINEDLSIAIKEQYQKRQKKIDELQQRYDNLYPDASFVEPEGFYEWLRNKDAPADDAKVEEFIDSIQLNSVIDFQQLSRNDRSKAFERMKEKLEEVIGELAITKRFLINFRINGEWRSRTLTPQIWNKLMDSLNKQEFIYGKEVFETSIVHFSPDGDSEFFKFVYFDAISFTPVSASGNNRKDNRSDIDLSRYQIFDSIVRINKKGKAKQRKELNDSCFVYALKQAGIDEDTLNKIRRRILVRKLGHAKMDAICEEFNLHVVVHDLEYTSKNTLIKVKHNKYYFGSKDGLRIDLNSYKNHYFIEEKTIYTLDYIRQKYVNHEDVPEQCYNKRFVN